MLSVKHFSKGSPDSVDAFQGHTVDQDSSNTMGLKVPTGHAKDVVNKGCLSSAGGARDVQ